MHRWNTYSPTTVEHPIYNFSNNLADFTIVQTNKFVWTQMFAYKL